MTETGRLCLCVIVTYVPTEHTTALVTAETGFWWREQLKSSNFTFYIIKTLLQ